MQFNVQRFGFGLAATLILASGSAFAKQEWKFQINVNAGDDGVKSDALPAFLAEDEDSDDDGADDPQAVAAE